MVRYVSQGHRQCVRFPCRRVCIAEAPHAKLVSSVADHAILVPVRSVTMRKSYVRASGRLFATCARMAHRNGGVLGRGAGPQQRRPGPSRANSCFGETACVRLGSIVGGGLRVQRSLMSGAQSAAAAALRGPRTSMAGARALSPFAQGGRAGAQKALPHAASSIFPVRPWVFAFVTACCASPPTRQASMKGDFSQCDLDMFSGPP